MPTPAVLVDTLQAELGPALHRALHDAAESRASKRAWGAIGDMPNREWSAVVRLAVQALPTIDAATECPDDK